MAQNIAQKLIQAHLVEGEMILGEEIGLKIDQTLAQDATGTMVMLECEAMGLKRTQAEVSVQYVDHNLLQTDFKNADDHRFLLSACQKYGVWFSRPGNGVSHPVHMEHFGKPGKTLLGSDSHSCAAGSMGMLAMGAGGLEVAMAMAGRPFYISMPKVFGIKLIGQLRPWVSAKDIILEILRRHTVQGGIGKVIEYYGPGLATLTAMDRHVIANMGAELGATATVFPSDNNTQAFLTAHGRARDWIELKADDNATYDENDTVDLSQIVPLIALPSSPDKVVAVSEVAGREVFQVAIGSSANPGLRDFAVVANIVTGKQVHPRISFDINPTSRQILENMTHLGILQRLIHAGGRIHQAGCNGCIGMGQAPASQTISLRTFPRNFPGRSGTKEDLVYLCSPETAAASALTGVITDPTTLDIPYVPFKEPEKVIINKAMLIPPLENGEAVELQKGPNIHPLPKLLDFPDSIRAPVLIKVGDNISTDGIMPAGEQVLPLRSNIPAISKFVFAPIDPTYYDRAMQHQTTGSIIVGGKNYGQGSSREHAALAPRYLGVQVVIAINFARIHAQNLVNFGILPLKFSNPRDLETIDVDDILEIAHLHASLKSSEKIEVINRTKDRIYQTVHFLSERQLKELLAGGLINLVKMI